MAETDTSPAALRALADAISMPNNLYISSTGYSPVQNAAAALRALAAEKEAGAPAPAQGPLTEVGETSRGYKLYRAPNPVGGNTYWSDEIGGGVVVWDTCLVGEETLRLALSVETGVPAPDGWIPWEGGECPVADGKLVTVQFRNGETARDIAMACAWQHGMGTADIIAYRLS